MDLIETPETPARVTSGRIIAHARASSSRTNSARAPSSAYLLPTRSSTRTIRKRRHSDAEHSEGLPDASVVAANDTPIFTKRSRVSVRTPGRRRSSSGLKKSPPSANLKAPPPTSKLAVKNEQVEDGDKKPAAKVARKAVVDCCICMCVVEPGDLSQINGCEHRFCFGCIEKWSERENTCPLCKNRFTKIDRMSKRRIKGAKNTKKVRQRDQRSDLLPGAAIEGLLASLAGSSRSGIARLVFDVAAAHAAGPGASSDDWNLLDSDEDSPFSLFRSIRATPSGSAGFRFASFSSSVSSRTSSFSFYQARMPTPPQIVFQRSHATNDNDLDAGVDVTNPLEIASDSDDEVEVVHVERATP